MAIGYAGLRYIELSISSPVCNSSGAVAAILCALVLGQTMDGIQLVGTVLVTVGVLAIEAVDIKLDHRFDKKDKYVNSLKAVIYPLIYCAIDGLGTFGYTFFLLCYPIFRYGEFIICFKCYSPAFSCYASGACFQENEHI